MIEKMISAVKQMKREQWIICGLAGVILLVIAMPVKKEETKENDPEKEKIQEEETGIQEEYEQKLTEALTQVHGVGAVQVVISMESTGKKIVEKDLPEDSEVSSQKDGQGSENTSQTTSIQESTVYEEGESGSQTPYVISRIYPEIRGVLVIAEGGDDPELVRQIQEAVMALFHVDAHKIKVLKMK